MSKWRDHLKLGVDIDAFQDGLSYSPYANKQILILISILIMILILLFFNFSKFELLCPSLVTKRLTSTKSPFVSSHGLANFWKPSPKLFRCWSVWYVPTQSEMYEKKRLRSWSRSRLRSRFACLRKVSGKHTSADRCRYFDSARGSALECAACLDVLVAKKKIDGDIVKRGKNQLYQIVSVLIGLIRANSLAKCVKRKIKIKIEIKIKTCY